MLMPASRTRRWSCCVMICCIFCSHGNYDTSNIPISGIPLRSWFRRVGHHHLIFIYIWISTAHIVYFYYLCWYHVYFFCLSNASYFPSSILFFLSFFLYVAFGWPHSKTGMQIPGARGLSTRWAAVAGALGYAFELVLVCFSGHARGPQTNNGERWRESLAGIGSLMLLGQVMSHPALKIVQAHTFGRILRLLVKVAGRCGPKALLSPMVARTEPILFGFSRTFHNNVLLKHPVTES